MRPPTHRPLANKLVALLALAALATCSSLALAQAEIDLPEIGEPAGTLLDKSDEYEYGLMVQRTERAQNQILEDPETEEYIQSLGTRIAAQSQMGAAHFHYYVIRDGDIDAFSVPYFIFCNYGTIVAMQDESELAAILAHETAHDTQHHIAREIQAQTRQTLTAAAEMLAAVLIGAAGGGAPAIEGGIAAAQGLDAQEQIYFSVTQEEEADRIGMQYLERAGFDPEAMAGAFELVEQRYGYGMGLIPAFLQDHPVTSDRIADARARAAQMPRPRNLESSIDFLLIRERLRVITAPQDYDIVAYYHKLGENHPLTLPEQYGEALADLEREQPKEAVRILKPLVAQNSSVTLLCTALGQAEIAAGETHDGLATFADGERLFPRNVPLTVRYAEALIKVGQPKYAHDLLNDLFNVFEPTPSQIQLIARAASDAGDKGDAYDYMGEYYISDGNLPLASEQLELALRAPHLTDVQRERFEARLKEVRDVMAEVRRENHGKLPGGG